MTAADIAQRLLSGPQTPERVQKAKGLAQRSQVAWRDVDAILFPPVLVRDALDRHEVIYVDTDAPKRVKTKKAKGPYKRRTKVAA